MPDKPEGYAPAEDGPGVRIAAVLLIQRNKRTPGGECYSGGYGGQGCDTPDHCRCIDECEEDAAALIVAGMRME